MAENREPLDAIEDIRKLMDQSSRFISLSGWSGVAAGVCALAAAGFTALQFDCWRRGDCEMNGYSGDGGSDIRYTLVLIAAVTFVLAFTLAFFFTYVRSRRTGVSIWGRTAKRVVINVAVPMLVGGLFILRLMEEGLFGFIAPACLLFYGLGLVNASKYTLTEIRYLGYGQLLLGVVNLWFVGYGLYFWAAGFGVLHVLYGIIMWNKYEREPS
ncbi:MAG TPA: hypothetical protein VHK69_08625 [Chitinophagaceae bacterium]|jgi:hypothetical protein|nr:hypothetical protein [Chitinophagaceae bacterium]